MTSGHWPPPRTMCSALAQRSIELDGSDQKNSRSCSSHHCCRQVFIFVVVVVGGGAAFVLLFCLTKQNNKSEESLFSPLLWSSLVIDVIPGDSCCCWIFWRNMSLIEGHILLLFMLCYWFLCCCFSFLFNLQLSFASSPGSWEFTCSMLKRLKFSPHRMKKVSATRFLRVHMFGPGTKCRCASCSQLPDDCTYIVIFIIDAVILILVSYLILKNYILSHILHFHSLNCPWSLLPSRTVQGSKSCHPRSKSTISSRWGGGIYAGTLLLYAQVQLSLSKHFYFHFLHRQLSWSLLLSTYIQKHVYFPIPTAGHVLLISLLLSMSYRSLLLKFFFQLQVFVQCASMFLEFHFYFLLQNCTHFTVW